MNNADSASLDHASAASRPRRSATGDRQAESAVTALYQEHALGLTRLAHIMLGDKASAEDVVQEAFCGPYRNWARLADPAGALPYLRASVFNRCRSAGRRRMLRASRAVHERAAAALDFYFPATGAQNTAGLAFDWTRRKISARIFGSCMADAGFPQPPLSVPERSFLLAFPDNSQFPDLAQRARTDSMSGPPYITTSPVAPKTAAGRRAVRRCTTESDHPFAGIDKIATPLEGQWLNIITAIQSSAPVRAMRPGFSACLEAHAIPAAHAAQQTQASNPLFNGFFAWIDHLTQTATSTRQQTAEDHHWTPVFVRCARPTVTVMQRLQLTRQARFNQHGKTAPLPQSGVDSGWDLEAPSDHGRRAGRAARNREARAASASATPLE